MAKVLFNKDCKSIVMTLFKAEKTDLILNI